MQELKNMVAQLSHRLESFEGSHTSLSRTEDDNTERSLLRNDRSKTTVERSLSPVLIRNKGRNRQLSPMSHNYKKTLHVCYIFIIKIYLLLNL
jgi:hypothetical protein